jgi:hypothetical protein
VPYAFLTEAAIYAALRALLLDLIVTPAATTEIVRAQDNRVPQPYGNDFAIFTPLRSERLATNQTAYVEVRFTGSIVDDLMTVSDLTFGTGLIPGTTVASATLDVAVGTAIVAQLTGATGDVGTNRVAPGGQNVVTTTSDLLYASSRFDLAATRLTVQVDWYGPHGWVNAQAVETLFRSSYGTRSLEALNVDVTSLYCSEARQVAFVDGEQQWEDRWMTELTLQVNPTILVFQPAATNVEITLVPADLL